MKPTLKEAVTYLNKCLGLLKIKERISLDMDPEKGLNLSGTALCSYNDILLKEERYDEIVKTNDADQVVREYFTEKWIEADNRKKQAQPQPMQQTMAAQAPVEPALKMAMSSKELMKAMKEFTVAHEAFKKRKAQLVDQATFNITIINNTKLILSDRELLVEGFEVFNLAIKSVTDNYTEFEDLYKRLLMGTTAKKLAKADAHKIMAYCKERDALVEEAYADFSRNASEALTEAAAAQPQPQPTRTIPPPPYTPRASDQKMAPSAPPLPSGFESAPVYPFMDSDEDMRSLSPSPPQPSSPISDSPPRPQVATPAPVLYVASADFAGQQNGALSFKRGDVIAITQKLANGWWQGTLNGKVGYFPGNYLQLPSPPRPSAPPLAAAYPRVLFTGPMAAAAAAIPMRAAPAAAEKQKMVALQQACRTFAETTRSQDGNIFSIKANAPTLTTQKCKELTSAAVGAIAGQPVIMTINGGSFEEIQAVLVQLNGPENSHVTVELGDALKATLAAEKLSTLEFLVNRHNGPSPLPSPVRPSAPPLAAAGYYPGSRQPQVLFTAPKVAVPMRAAPAALTAVQKEAFDAIAFLQANRIPGAERLSLNMDPNAGLAIAYAIHDYATSKQNIPDVQLRILVGCKSSYVQTYFVKLRDYLAANIKRTAVLVY